MRVLVTRPQPDADKTAGLLHDRGHTPLVAPLIEIMMDDPVGPLETCDVQAFLVTSANGVRALAAATDSRNIKVLAVGAASAETARHAGFGDVESADGDVETLAALVQARLVPANGRLIHIAGSVSAGDLGGSLAKAGFSVEKRALYRAETAKVLPPALEAALRENALDAALFFSPRTARTLVNLTGSAGLDTNLRNIRAFCLSRAVAEALGVTRFSDVHVSYAPIQSDLLSLLEANP